ncbi:MAG: DUF3857 and transglutaminase domain-containing protein [Chitinophagaceae bacterium]
MKRLSLILLGFVAICQLAIAQKSIPPPVKFGKVTPEDFKKTVYSLDSNASAIVIADIGSTEMVGNDKGSFSLEFKNYRRAQILNKNGYDIANVEIWIYTRGDLEEELSSLKAVTYNLENGKVVETKLDVKGSVFKDKISQNQVVKKFTFPNIKEGSIIEYEYKIHSDFTFNFQPWTFQGEYPSLWSEYTVSIPEFYYYVTMAQGYQPFVVKEQKTRRDNFTVSSNNTAYSTDRSSFSANVGEWRWAMQNIPALKEESYTSTLRNHVAKIEFQLAELRYPFTPRNVMGTWPSTCEDLLKDEDFGAQLAKDNGWLNDVMDDAIGKATTKVDKARNIYAYVRDNMTCTNYNRIYLEKNLRQVLKSRNGNESEINLLLVAMFRKAGIDADPVILSTRSHGYAYALYPLMSKFNYVIAQSWIDGKAYYLDASRSQLGFNKLAYECYNGHARVVSPQATALDFNSDSLRERKLTSVFIINDEKGNMTGSLTEAPGYFESNSIRNKIKSKGKNQFFSDIKKDLSTDMEMQEEVIDSLDKYDDPVSVRYKFDIKNDKPDILYFNPMFTEGWKENPFKSAERYYPVEMPYTMDETYLLRLDVPEGYEIDELPKQVIVKLNEQDDGMFEYRLSASNGVISLRSRLRISRAYFMPEEYEMLREFFALVVKKHAEQIVFKKKK